jgi:hypothetical protein
MDLYQLEEYAKKHGFNSVEFEFTNFLGEVKKARWLDAYYGFFILEGSEGFSTVSQYAKYGADKLDYRVISSH